jgi:hypothetical protein
MMYIEAALYRGGGGNIILLLVCSGVDVNVMVCWCACI